MKTIHPFNQIDFTKSFSAHVIEASAGTGKTWTIERLFVKALLEKYNSEDKQLKINNILVLTFTKDATSELKERIYVQIKQTINLIVCLQHHLDNISTESDNLYTKYLINRSNYHQQDFNILTLAAQNFAQASIYTIHGFCKKLLEDYAFDYSVDYNFDLVTDKKQYIYQGVLTFFRQKIINADFVVQQKLSTVIANLEQLFASGDYQLTLLQRISAKLANDLFKINQRELVIAYNHPTIPNLELLTLDDLNADDELKRAAKTEFLAAVMQFLAQSYPLLSKLNGAINYDELIQIVADGMNETLAQKIFEVYPVAFIDEFQDTDNLQWQIFSSIYQLNNNPTRGHIVVVGDPKQAIYRFRGADVETYLQAKQQINCTLSLKDNFRSHPDIINFINQLFNLNNQNHIVTNSFLGSGIDYKPIKAKANHFLKLTRSNTNNQALYDQAVQLVVINGKTKTARDYKLLQVMVFEILTLIKSDPTLTGKIAILVAKKREANRLIAELKHYNIKAKEVKLISIFTTTTALSLYRIMLALSDLTNRKNFILALTGKIFNLGLEDFMLNRESDINHETQFKMDDSLLNYYTKQFFSYKIVLEQEGVFALIYALITDLSNQNRNGLSNRELANLGQLAQLLYQTKIQNQDQLLYWFNAKIVAAKDLFYTEDDNNEELLGAETDDQQIIITTQHKAKGLEYDILFCPTFKNEIILDARYDYNYHRPFFTSYHQDGIVKKELVLDQELAKIIVNNDNKENHRLNYVALTRAKSRIYIYLKAHTKTAKGSYNTLEKPDYLAQLFGYVKNNPHDSSHSLFNYPQFFTATPQIAIKNPELFSGVAVYNRDNLSPKDLIGFNLNYCEQNNRSLAPQPLTVNSQFKIARTFSRQSYSSLSSSSTEIVETDYYEKKALIPLVYRYSVLNQCSGALFGVLFHELCENYPLNSQVLTLILKKHNLDQQELDYQTQFLAIINETFDYPLLNGLGLKDFSCALAELEFNILINNKSCLAQELSIILNPYFGCAHPFSLALKKLTTINMGFLVGFIDFTFCYQGKYWILDYKTNSLDDYSSPSDIFASNNSIIDSMAEHHYYLQYLIYLVALKRFLEFKLKIVDATDLIGGAIYYYIRGVFIFDNKNNSGVYLDRNCQNVVAKIDNLLLKFAS